MPLGTVDVLVNNAAWDFFNMASPGPTDTVLLAAWQRAAPAPKN